MREAQRALAAMVADVVAGKVSSTTVTMDERLSRGLDHVGEQLSPTTVREYRRLVATRLGPELGMLTLRRVTTPARSALHLGTRSGRSQWWHSL